MVVFKVSGILGPIGVLVLAIWLTNTAAFLFPTDAPAPLVCYHGYTCDSLNNCTANTTCGADEICYVNSTMRGCIKSSACPAQPHPSQTPPDAPIVGRSIDKRAGTTTSIAAPTSPTSSCSKCCFTSLCNNDSICDGKNPGAVDTSNCTDSGQTDCAVAQTLFQVCKDVHHAKTVCKRTCGLCNLVDGEWGDWKEWTACSVTCLNGTQSKSRSCDSPKPQHKGENCTGNATETRVCAMRLCPVDGHWAIWEEWGNCSETCGAGLQFRVRNCSNPAPSLFGQHCFGYSRDVRVCNRDPCIGTNGGWSAWGNYSDGDCSVTCGGGIHSRHRNCTNPEPSGNGRQCPGDDREYDSCAPEACPVDGFWSAWSAWTCQSAPNGPRHRTRVCIGPFYEGRVCTDGHGQESESSGTCN